MTVVAATTSANAVAYVYDGPAGTHAVAHEGVDSGTSSSLEPAAPEEVAAPPRAAAEGTSTTLGSTFVAPNTTRLVPGGGLSGHEAVGGHTLSRHVGRTDADLAARLQNQPNVPAASTFGNRSVAESSIASTLDANQPGIQAWLRSGGGNQGSAFTHGFNSPVGTSLVRGSPGPVQASNVRVVLRPDASMPDGYRILTAFPEL